MNKRQVNKIIAEAENHCVNSGARLTEKRKRILEVMLLADKPLSAYEIADEYSKGAQKNIAAMSVYRILSFLESEQLVHKLSSTNKFIACSHIACSHTHQVPQFLICGECQSVKEIAIDKSTVDGLGNQVAEAGYKLLNSQIELQCICNDCLEATSVA